MLPRSLTLSPVVTLAFLAACATAHPPAPTAALRSVDRPPAAATAYGPSRIGALPDTAPRFVFEDSAVRVVWRQGERAMGLELTNKTAQSLRIVWDGAVMVGRNGASLRVMPSGTNYIDRFKSHPPTVIAAHGFWSGAILPADRVTFAGGKWVVPPLFDADAPDGQMRILLPLEIEAATHEYTFTFDVRRPSPSR